MTKQKTAKELEQDWWAAWREEDFSWAGLGQKRWDGWFVAQNGELIAGSGSLDGARPATLQDYWKDEKPHLIEGDSKLWTRVHCPLVWSDGTPTPKASWDDAAKSRLDSALSSLLAGATETKFEGEPYDRRPLGADHRAQFQGAVLIRTSLLRRGVVEAISTRLEWAFISGAKFGGMVFAGDTRFDSAFFADACSFGGTKFNGYTRFYRAVFAGAANFKEAHFVGNAGLTDCVFCSSAHFESAKFDGYASFVDSVFAGSADFESATVAASADFEKVAFHKGAAFSGATFSSDVNFSRTVISGDFVGRSTFCGASTFSGAKFLAKANFEWAIFKDIVVFEPGVFFKEATFERATFQGVASFHSSTFHGEANFAFAHFARRARFADTTFQPGNEAGRVTFENTQFSELADFGEAKFPTRCHQFSAAFNGTRFGGVANFVDAGAHWIAAFDGAFVEKNLLLDELPEAVADKQFFKVMLPGTRSTRIFDVEARTREEKKAREELAENTGEPVREITKEEIAQWARQAPHERLRELVGGCRVVKAAMGRERAEVLEHRYYRYQLIARRKQKGTPLAEKVFSWLYGLISDYGMGLWQPFAALVLFTLCFGGIYWTWGEALRGWPEGFAPIAPDGLARNAWDALQFSANNIFRPFGVWSSEYDGSSQAGWLVQFLETDNGGHRVFIRLVASFQSLLAVILFFLFGLAVRRRFQIG